MPPAKQKTPNFSFTYKTQKVNQDGSPVLKFYKEDEQIKCENPQSVPEPVEAIGVLMHAEKMRKFDLEAIEIDEEISKCKEKVD